MSEDESESSHEERPRGKGDDRILVNVSETQYSVVREVCRQLLRWRLQFEKEGVGWDLFWTDSAVQAETLGRMGSHQKINHFPGMFTLARKNYLARGLNRLRKRFEEQYSFYPQTWLLPVDYMDLKTNMESKQKGKARTYIAKPEASSQGRGIFLTRSLQSFDLDERYVVQRYLTRPYLLDGLKFDLRIYVLLAGCDPLRVYLYREGLGRLATVPYEGPRLQNLSDLCMHLTNYAINKDSDNFIFNQNKKDMGVGHKRSLSSVLKWLEGEGVDIAVLMGQIKDIVVKTLIVGQPVLSHHYQACQSENLANNMCFELLGFDIILDHKATPFLLEVNHTPSFTTDTPLDQHVKEQLIRDALRLMNISPRARDQALAQRRAELQQRMLTGKKQKLTPEQRRQEIDRQQQIRNEYELRNLGGFELIFPCEESLMDRYRQFSEFSAACYEESTGAHIRRNVKKPTEPRKAQRKPVQERRQVAGLLPEVIVRTTLRNTLSLTTLCKKAKSTVCIAQKEDQIAKEDEEPKCNPWSWGRRRFQLNEPEESRTEQVLRAPVIRQHGNFVQPKIFVPTFICSSLKGQSQGVTVKSLNR